MKKFLKGILVFLPFIFALVFVNFTVDPANLFNQNYEVNVAHILASGYNASDLKNMDDRIMQVEYANIVEDEISTLVLGPSRGMQLSRELTNDENLYNVGVTGADLRDMISFYMLYESLDKLPENVILVVEPWLTGEDCLNTRAYTDGYENFAKSIDTKVLKTPSNTVETYKQLISFTYFQSAVDYVRADNSKSEIYETTEFYTYGDMRRADGSYCYNTDFRNASLEDREHEALNCIIKTPDIIKSFDKSSEILEKQFTEFILYLKSHGANVAIMLPPINPIYYDYMSENMDEFGNMLDTENFYLQVAKDNNIEIFGSFNPHLLNLTTNDFYDGLHCTDTALETFYPQDLW